MEQEKLVRKIIISRHNNDIMINHCVRKLNQMYNDDETKEQQAFGVIIGKKIDNNFYITKVVPLRINYRFNEAISDKMNNLIKKYAIPGGLNVEERAWVSDPSEISSILADLNADEEFFGTYHMHHNNSWKGNYPKQLPTKLDRILSKDSGLYGFIVFINITDEQQNGARAFYESKVEDEIEIEITND